MARPFKHKKARIAFGMTSLAAAGAIMTALITSGTAYADAVLPGATGSYSLSASSAGLYVAVAGMQLTGGTASVSGTYNSTGSGTPAEDAKASGGGFLLSSQVLGTEPSVEAGGTTGLTTDSATQGTTGDPANPGGGSDVDSTGPSTPPDCDTGGGEVASGVGGFVGLGCGYATASVDAAGGSSVVGPQALAAGNMVTASLDLGGILSQVYTGGASQLCTALGSIPTLGTTLENTCTNVLSVATNASGVVTGVLNPSVQVNVGNAYSEIVGTASEVYALSQSSSIDISIFPGLDSGVEPLLRVQIPAATAVSCEGTGCPTGAPGCTTTTGGWTNSYDAGVIRLSGLLIDDLDAVLGAIPLFSSLLSTVSGLSELEIPPACSASGVEAVNSSPLGSLLQIHLASAAVSGSGVSGSGAQIELLPTQGPNGSPIVDLNTAGIQTSNTGTMGAAVAPAAAPPAAAPAPVLQAAQSPTSVHTGEWWAGSLPLLAVLAALGGGLLGWPRIRRFPMVARLVSKGSH